MENLTAFKIMQLAGSVVLYGLSLAGIISLVYFYYLGGKAAKSAGIPGKGQNTAFGSQPNTDSATGLESKSYNELMADFAYHRSKLENINKVLKTIDKSITATRMKAHSNKGNYQSDYNGKQSQ